MLHFLRRPTLALNQAEDHFAFFADHVLVPGWVPDDVDFGFAHAGDAFELAFGVFGDGGTHATAGSGHGHVHVELVAALKALFGVERVNQSQIDNVDGNFGVEDLFEGFPERVFFGRRAVVLVFAYSGLGDVFA